MDIFEEEERVPINHWKEDGRQKDATQSNYGSEMQREETAKLRPKIGLVSGICVIVGSVIGAGIFISPAGVLRHAGSVGLSLVIWVLCGVFSFIGAHCYAELGTTIIRSGGDYAYVYEAFGPFFAFIRLWVECLIVRPVCQAIVAMTFAEHILIPFYPDCLPPHTPTIILAVLCIFLATFINCWDVKWATATQNVFTAVKLLGLIVVIITGFVQLGKGRTGNFNNPFEGTNKDAGEISLAFYAALFAYNGWNNLNFIVEELHEPERNLPKALIISSLVVITVYILTNVAYFTAIPPIMMLEAPSVAVLFGNTMYGSMAWIMPFLVVLSTFGAFNGLLLTTSRLHLAGTRQGQMPQVLGMVQIDQETPVPAVLFTSLISLVYLASGKNIYALINHVSIINWLSIGVSIFVLIYLRWKRPNIDRPFKILLFWPVLYLVCTIFVIVLPLYRRPEETGIGLLLILTALPVYFGMLYWKEKPLVFEKLTDYLTCFTQKTLLVC